MVTIKTETTAHVLGSYMAAESNDTQLWSRVTKGELSVNQAERLVSSGRREDLQSRRDVARARALFAPQSPSAMEAQIGSIFARLDTETGVRGSNTVRSVAPWLIGLFAVAAAMVLALTLHDGSSSSPIAGGYRVELGSVLAVERGDSPDVRSTPRLAAHGFLDVRLVPRDAVPGQIAVAAFAAASANAVMRIDIDATINEFGVIRVEQPLAEMGLLPGKWTLSFIVGRPETLPESWLDVDSSDSNYEVLETRIHVVDGLAPP